MQEERRIFKWSEWLVYVSAPNTDLDSFLQKVFHRIAFKDRDVVISFEEVDHLEDWSMAKMVNIQTSLNEVDRKLVLCSMSEGLQRELKQVLEVNKVKETFQIEPDRVTAMAKLGIVS